MPKKIVLCHGCFDLLHPGHVRYLQAAKKLGDMLIVSVTSDRYVNKGAGRPLWNQNQRAQMLCALRDVDLVIVSDAPTSCDIIKALRPTFYVKGKDYKGTWCEEFETAKSVGAEVVFLETEKFSTTELIERLKHDNA